MTQPEMSEIQVIPAEQYANIAIGVAQALAVLQQVGQTAPGVLPQPQVEKAVEARRSDSSLERFMVRRAGSLVLAGVCAFGGAVSYSVTSGHNLFKHPADISRPVDDVKHIIHVLKAL